jgi:hypothetical protein
MAVAKVSGARNSGLQDDHDPNDIGRRAASKQKSQMEGPAATAPHDEGEKKSQGIVRDERGQEQPADKRKAQQTSSRRQHGQDDPPLNKEDAPRAFPDRDPAKKKTGEF